MKNSNNDRVRNLREVDSYTIDNFNPKEVEWLSTNECKAWLYGQLGETITVNLAGSRIWNWFSARWSIKIKVHFTL